MSDEDKNEKNDVFDKKNLYECWELVFNACNSGLFLLKSAKGTGLKILTSKQMPQKLPIALAQVKAGNNSEYSLNDILQIVYSLYQSKEISRQ